jgi:trehalose 6-phosphate phosphatase
LHLRDGPDVCALFLDIDGTLLEIAPTPEAVIVPPGLADLVGGLTSRLKGAVAIVTGRPIDDVDRFLQPLLPVAAGVHGAEFRNEPGGRVELHAELLDPGVLAAVRRLADDQAGIIIERKLTSIAVHYRLAPSAGPRLEGALEQILAEGPDHLILCRGRKVFEVVPRYISKGSALARFMERDPFRGRRPVMIGDDLSDQSAFEAAVRLGGVGLKVGGERFGPAEADFSGPSAVRAWLAEWAGIVS